MTSQESALVGQRIGGYEVLQSIGQGGMGAVFRVRSPAGEELALKVLLDGNLKRRRRFLREAQVMQFLGRHPHVLGLRHYGEEGGRPFLIMDLIRGGTFADRLHRMGRDACLPVLVQVARALHFAHEAGVIHRDLKPSNVLMDVGDQPVVADFGLAKDLQDQEALTRTGEVVGTVSYMAPEQVRGRAFDRRTDVYALGVMLYEVLAGRPPYAGDSPLAVLAQIVDGSPAPPSSVALEPVPPELEAVCLRAIAKDPRRRPATAEAFARELELALAGERPVIAGASPRALRASLAGNLLLGAALLAATAALLGPPAAQVDFDAAAYRVGTGRPLTSDQLEHLEAQAEGSTWGRWLPYLAASSALLADAPPEQVGERIAALPAGSERDLLAVDAWRADAATEDGEEPEVVALLERAEHALLPWRTEPAHARWERLAARLAAAGLPRAAARAWVRAGERALRAGAPARRCIAALDGAFTADPYVACSEGAPLAPLLLEAAHAILVRPAGAPPATLHELGRARRHLARYRLLEPETPLPPAVLGALEGLVAEDDWERLGAILPGLPVLGPYRHQLPPLLSRPLTPEEQAALVCGVQATFPGRWQEFFTRQRRLSTTRDRLDCLEAALLWRPELRPLWFDLGWCLEREGQLGLARRAQEVIHAQEDDAHITHRLSRIHYLAGHLTAARRYGLRTLELDEQRETFDPYHTWQHAMTLDRLLEHAEALPLIEQVLGHSRFQDDGRVWEAKARALRGLGRERAAAQAVERARRAKQ